ncbi:putative COMPASS component SPP1 [Paratrimastix pyriformis]|uniref:COMPASS component SPP1 n=1 Tax=Paratrimastix pyriformis TaxID=342808 RepID=A0ABQ8UI68_9EUKA|nr:putative COMPASS component SPP1 [Paratrimastix pyriformis]
MPRIIRLFENFEQFSIEEPLRCQKRALGFRAAPPPPAEDVRVEEFEPNRLFCVCKKPYVEGEWMVFCEGCKDWFHGPCVGTTPEMCAEVQDYYCPSCRAKGIPPPPPPPEKHRKRTRDTEEKGLLPRGNLPTVVTGIITTAMASNPLPLALKSSPLRRRLRSLHSITHMSAIRFQLTSPRRPPPPHRNRGKAINLLTSPPPHRHQPADLGPDDGRGYAQEACKADPARVQAYAASTEAVRGLATQIELALFDHFKSTSKEYRNQCRSIDYNLRDPKNASFRTNVLMGTLSPAQLAAITSYQMSVGTLTDVTQAAAPEAVAKFDQQTAGMSATPEPPKVVSAPSTLPPPPLPLAAPQGAPPPLPMPPAVAPPTAAEESALVDSDQGQAMADKYANLPPVGWEGTVHLSNLPAFRVTARLLYGPPVFEIFPETLEIAGRSNVEFLGNALAKLLSPTQEPAPGQPRPVASMLSFDSTPPSDPSYQRFCDFFTQKSKAAVVKLKVPLSGPAALPPSQTEPLLYLIAPSFFDKMPQSTRQLIPPMLAAKVLGVPQAAAAVVMPMASPLQTPMAPAVMPAMSPAPETPAPAPAAPAEAAPAPVDPAQGPMAPVDSTPAAAAVPAVEAAAPAEAAMAPAAPAAAPVQLPQ